MMILSTLAALGWTGSLFAFRWLLWGPNDWVRDGDVADTAVRAIVIFVGLVLIDAAARRIRATSETNAEASSSQDDPHANRQ